MFTCEDALATCSTQQSEVMRGGSAPQTGETSGYTSSSIAFTIKFKATSLHPLLHDQI
jgi:hypothetical protein